MVVLICILAHILGVTLNWPMPLLLDQKAPSQERP